MTTQFLESPDPLTVRITIRATKGEPMEELKDFSESIEQKNIVVQDEEWNCWIEGGWAQY